MGFLLEFLLDSKKFSLTKTKSLESIEKSIKISIFVRIIVRQNYLKLYKIVCNIFLVYLHYINCNKNIEKHKTIL